MGPSVVFFKNYTSASAFNTRSYVTGCAQTLGAIGSTGQVLQFSLDSLLSPYKALGGFYSQYHAKWRLNIYWPKQNNVPEPVLLLSACVKYLNFLKYLYYLPCWVFAEFVSVPVVGMLVWLWMEEHLLSSMMGQQLRY